MPWPSIRATRCSPTATTAHHRGVRPGHGRLRLAGPEPLSGGVRRLAFSPDGRALAAVGSGTDNRVALWDVERGEPAGELRAPDDARLWRIALSPDGRTLAAGGCEKTEDEACTQGAIHLWDLARKERLGQALVGHTDWVTGLAFSADSRLLASGSDDSTVRLWDVADPARARSGAPAHQPRGEVVIRSLAFSPAGRTLASGDRNGTIILWDASGRQPREVARLTDHGGAILSLAFSPDGRTLVSGSHDRTIRLWDVASRRPSARAWPPGRSAERGLPPGREGAGVGGEGRADLPLGRGPALLAREGLRGRRPGAPSRRAGEPSGRRRACPWRPAFEETCAQDALRRADARPLADEPSGRGRPSARRWRWPPAPGTPGSTTRCAGTAASALRRRSAGLRAGGAAGGGRSGVAGARQPGHRAGGHRPAGERKRTSSSTRSGPQTRTTWLLCW